MRWGPVVALILAIPAVMIITAGITMIAPYLAALAVVLFAIRQLLRHPGTIQPAGKDEDKPP